MHVKISLKKGDVYKLNINNLAGAGYTWVVEKNDEAITTIDFKSLAGEKDQKNKSAVGGATHITAFIKAVGKGKTTIKLTLKRIWETTVPPLDTCTVDVKVE